MNTINTSKNIVLAAVAAVSVFGFVAGAQAGEKPVDADSRVVSYADLNLDTAAGAKVLYQRIHKAAVQVCGDTEDSRQLGLRATIKACMDQAIVSSVRAVNRPQLSRTADAHGYPVPMSFELASAR